MKKTNSIIVALGIVVASFQALGQDPNYRQNQFNALTTQNALLPTTYFKNKDAISAFARYSTSSDIDNQFLNYYTKFYIDNNFITINRLNIKLLDY
jgi:hypothetical protein